MVKRYFCYESSSNALINSALKYTREKFFNSKVMRCLERATQEATTYNVIDVDVFGINYKELQIRMRAGTYIFIGTICVRNPIHL